MYNIGRFGTTGDLPMEGHYFGRGDAVGLAALGAVDNSVSFLLRGREQALEGMAADPLSPGCAPLLLSGPPQVELRLSEFAEIGETEPRTLLSEWQVLRGRVTPGIDTSGTRQARIEELDTLVEMGQAMQRETFDLEGMDDASLGELLRLQIELGGAFVREVEGVVVSKGEATPVVPHAALVGGVYTLPEHRGRGHSTACVAALCEGMLKRVGAITLSVELENQAAHRAYRRIGFEKVTDWEVVTFAGRREPGP